MLISKTEISNRELPPPTATPNNNPNNNINNPPTRTPPPLHTHPNEIREALRLIRDTSSRESREPYSRLMTFTLRIKIKELTALMKPARSQLCFVIESTQPIQNRFETSLMSQWVNWCCCDNFFIKSFTHSLHLRWLTTIAATTTTQPRFLTKKLTNSH